MRSPQLTSTIEPTEKKPLNPTRFPDAPIQDRATEGAALADEGEITVLCQARRKSRVQT